MPLYTGKQFAIRQHLDQRQEVCEVDDTPNPQPDPWSYVLVLSVPGMPRGFQCQAWQHYCCSDACAQQALAECTEQHLKPIWDGKVWTDEEQEALQQLTMPLVCAVCQKQQPANACIVPVLTLAHAGDPAKSSQTILPAQHIVCSWTCLEAALKDCLKQ